MDFNELSLSQITGIRVWRFRFEIVIADEEKKPMMACFYFTK